VKTRFGVRVSVRVRSSQPVKITQLVTIISRDEKNNAWAVGGPLRLGGPGPGPTGPIG